MASCLLSGCVTLSTQCGYQTSGVAKLAFLNNVDGISFTKDSDGVITAITVPTGTKQYDFSGYSNETASVTQTLTVSGQTKYIQTAVTAQYPYSLGLVQQIDALALGRFIGFYQDKSGNVFMVGQTGLQSDGNMVYSSGQQLGDAAGLTINLASAETAWLQPVESWDVVSQLFDC